MAKKYGNSKKDKETKAADFNTEVSDLKKYGPRRLYLLYGEEDYLRGLFAETLKNICLPDGEDSFSFKRFDGLEPDYRELTEAIDALPFMTERTYIEIHDADLNKLEEPQKLLKILSDIPDYCTVAFIQSASYELDGRVKLVKGIKELGCELRFCSQSQSRLIDWVKRRFLACGKNIEMDAIQRLIFLSGDLMNRLIPEIEKVAAFAAGEKVTVEDVNTVAHKLPEASIFEMTENIALKNNRIVMQILEELLSDKNNEPIFMLAMLGIQMRQLYMAKLAEEKQLGSRFLIDSGVTKSDYVAVKLVKAARGFEMSQLVHAVKLCAENDFRMKSSGEDSTVLFKETVLRIAAGETDA